MRTKDFDQTIDILDEEVSGLLENLTGMDAKSDEYEKVSSNLKTMLENQQLAVKNKNDHLAGKVPGWVTSIVGGAIAVLFGSIVMRVEQKGGVVSSQAINLWDKVVRKL